MLVAEVDHHQLVRRERAHQQRDHERGHQPRHLRPAQAPHHPRQRRHQQRHQQRTQEHQVRRRARHRSRRRVVIVGLDAVDRARNQLAARGGRLALAPQPHRVRRHVPRPRLRDRKHHQRTALGTDDKPDHGALPGELDGRGFKRPRILVRGSDPVGEARAIEWRIGGPRRPRREHQRDREGGGWSPAGSTFSWSARGAAAAVTWRPCAPAACTSPAPPDRRSGPRPSSSAPGRPWPSRSSAVHTPGASR